MIVTDQGVPLASHGQRPGMLPTSSAQDRPLHTECPSPDSQQGGVENRAGEHSFVSLTIEALSGDLVPGGLLMRCLERSLRCGISDKLGKLLSLLLTHRAHSEWPKPDSAPPGPRS